MKEVPTVAVITGNHNFDVTHFHRLFRSFSDADVYIQHMEMFAASKEEVRKSYDVLLFYHMFVKTPVDDKSGAVEGEMAEEPAQHAGRRASRIGA